MAGRRDDPSFAQVSGYIPKDVALRFKAICTLKEVSQTDALEQALQLWIAENNDEQLPQPKQQKGK